MGIGTNTAEWKTTQRDICRSSYYLLSKSTTERLYFFVVKIYQNQIELQLFSVVIVNGSSLKAEEKQNSWFLYRLYVRRPTSYGERVGQKDKFVLPLLGSPFTRWMGATGGKEDQNQNLMSKSQVITKNVNKIKLQISCCWKIQNLWMSNFSQLEVSTVVFK